MLIGGDDIINDVITLGTCFSMFVYIRAGPSFSRPPPRGAGTRDEPLRTSAWEAILFPPRCQSAPESLLAGEEYCDDILKPWLC